MTAKEHLQNWVNADYDTLMSEGMNAFFRLKPYMDAFADEQTDTDKEQDDCAAVTFAIIIARAVIADRQITETEARFIKALFRFEEEEMILCHEVSASDDHKVFNMFVDFLDREGKFALLDLITSIFACDETVKADEQRLLLDILARIG